MSVTPADSSQVSILPTIVLCSVFISLVFFCLLFMIVRHYSRKESIADLAREYGLQPLPHDGAAARLVMEHLERFEFLHSGAWQLDQIWEAPAPAGRPGMLRVMDLHGSPFGHIHDTELRITVVQLTLPPMDLPKFIVAPKNFWTRAFATQAAFDIQFGDVFSKHNILVGVETSAVRQLFSLPVRTCLRLNKKWTIEGVGDSLMLYQYPNRLSGHHVRRALQQGLALAQIMEQSPRARLTLRTA